VSRHTSKSSPRKAERKTQPESEKTPAFFVSCAEIPGNGYGRGVVTLDHRFTPVGVKWLTENPPEISRMKINGLVVDTQAIADGLYDIICEREEEAIVAFGMIPKWIMDLAEKLIREKIVAENAKRLNLTVEELRPYVDEKLRTETVNPILHEISLGIYTAAARAGKLLV